MRRLLTQQCLIVAMLPSVYILVFTPVAWYASSRTVQHLGGSVGSTMYEVVSDEGELVLVRLDDWIWNDPFQGYSHPPMEGCRAPNWLGFRQGRTTSLLGFVHSTGEYTTSARSVPEGHPRWPPNTHVWLTVPYELVVVPYWAVFLGALAWCLALDVLLRLTGYRLEWKLGRGGAAEGSADSYSPSGARRS